ncbi:hypothetical protein KEM48_002977 [Puccinia striiformis f. sp. tritici PST-130]|nr:hypothetical protein KEM48_002977 [Puccinia striiformis f. sp. tritici PST-130]
MSCAQSITTTYCRQAATSRQPTSSSIRRSSYTGRTTRRYHQDVLADQESRLDQQIDFNRSLREYRVVKKMEATARRDSIYEFMIYLTSELLKDPRPTLHSRDFDATLFKKKFGKLEKILSNDKHNPLYTQNLATFNIRDLSISSFTTEPYFEDLEPTTNLPSPALKKITRKPALPILSDSQDDLDEGPQNPEGTEQTPRILGDYPRTLSSDESQASSEMESEIRERGRDSGSGNHPDPHQKAGEDPRQVPEGNLERRQEINLGSGSTEPARPPETHPEQGNRELRERVEPLDRKEEGFPAPPKTKRGRNPTRGIIHDKAAAIAQIELTRITTETKPARTTATTKPREYEQKPSRSNNNNPQQAHSNNRENNKRHREESED